MFSPSQPGWFLLWMSIAWQFIAASVQGQILVGPFGTAPDPFTNHPPQEEWATRDTLLGASDTFNSPAELDAWAQTLDQSQIITTLPSTTSTATSRLARRNTTQSYLVTQPAGVPAVILRARLRNVSGMMLYAVTVSYDYIVAITGPFENIPGHRVYFSLTGQSNSWQLIPELSGLTSTTNVSAQIIPAGWEHGTDLYLLWLDDNAVTNSDGAYAIDNFAVSTVIPFDPSPVVITNSPRSLVVNERDSATFQVEAGGFPRAYYWFSNDVPVPGNNQPAFLIPSAAYPANDNARIHVVVSNSISVVTSSVATLNVTPDSTSPFVIQATGQTDLTKVLIQFSEALDPDTIVPGGFTLWETGTDPDFGLLILDAALLNGTNVLLTTETRTAGINYSLRILDVSDASSSRNLLNPNPTDMAVIRQRSELIGFDNNNLWHYSIETNLFGTGWEQPGYVESAETWVSGAAGLGVDTSNNGVPIRTTIPYAQNSAPQFFRRQFHLPSGTNGLVLSMRHLFEDAAVVFLNGREAGRYNVGPGPLSVATRASSAAAEPTPISNPVMLPTTNVHLGDNLIAVVVFQSGATSSDMEMALELTAEFPAYPQGPIAILSQPASTTLIEGAPLEFRVTVTGALPINYQWHKDNAALAGETNAVLRREAMTPFDLGSYFVVVSNSFGSVTSQVATVHGNDSIPTFDGAVGETNLTNILLTITDRFIIGRQPLEDPANYAVQPINGGNPLVVHLAALLNATNVLLTTSPRLQAKDYVVILSNIHNTSPAQNPISPSTRPLVSKIVVLSPDGVTPWRYQATGASLDGVNWTSSGYSASGWATGLSGFGSTNLTGGMPPGFELLTTNILAPAFGGPITTYYRVPFTFPGSTNNAHLEIVGVIDDGMIAYVNGTEAGRLRVTNAVPVSSTHLASGSAPQAGGSYVAETIVLTNLSSLVVGANLLAIELHQAVSQSSDAVFSIQLVAGTAHFIHGDPVVRATRNPARGEVTITWSGGTLVETSTLTTGGTTWTVVAGNPVSPYTFTPAPGAQRFFAVQQ